jgi:hypothetical protein
VHQSTETATAEAFDETADESDDSVVQNDNADDVNVEANTANVGDDHVDLNADEDTKLDPTKPSWTVVFSYTLIIIIYIHFTLLSVDRLNRHSH